jgi:uncharacterized protein YndB with AHSA1/START domain
MVNCDEQRSKKQQVPFDSQLDLIFERDSQLTLEQLWQGWTHPETLMKWFCPRPWKVTACRTELWPGGEFHTVMEGPNGERHDNSGCYLEVIPCQKLVWTNMMSKGYRPASSEDMGFAFVATIEFSRTASGTRYRATVQHNNPESRIQHEKMGFQEGWGLAFNQLVELFPPAP